MENNHFLICSCNSSEHTLRFMYDKGENEIYTEVYLNQHNNLFKRLLVAVKYVFGYTSKYGHFDCTILNKQSARKLNFFLRDFLK
jgi:hypothetical protein